LQLAQLLGFGYDPPSSYLAINFTRLKKKRAPVTSSRFGGSKW